MTRGIRLFSVCLNLYMCISNHINHKYNILTFDRPCNFLDFKTRAQLCVKVNKRQRKCHVNCVYVLPEEYVGIRKIFHDKYLDSIAVSRVSIGQRTGVNYSECWLDGGQGDSKLRS